MLTVLLSSMTLYGSELLDQTTPYQVQNVHFRDGVQGELIYEQGHFYVLEDYEKHKVEISGLYGLARGVNHDLLQHYESTRNVLFDVKKNNGVFEIYTRFLLLGGMRSSGFGASFGGGHNTNHATGATNSSYGAGISYGNTSTSVGIGAGYSGSSTDDGRHGGVGSYTNATVSHTSGNTTYSAGAPLSGGRVDFSVSRTF